MYSYDLEASLTRQFCHTAHYLTGQYMYQESFSFTEDTLVWDCSTGKRMLLISIQFDQQTHLILSFDCICAIETGVTASGIPIPKACHIKPDEKRLFMDQFSIHITKNIDIAMGSWERQRY